MVCDTRLKPQQTIQQRKDEVRKVIDKLLKDLAAGRVKPKVNSAGMIAFQGLTDTDRDGVTDACIYRRLQASGSTVAMMAIQQAERMAGRRVNVQGLAHGQHSHDGGQTWHASHKH